MLKRRLTSFQLSKIDMNKSKKQCDPVTENFKSIVEVMDFWDAHDLGDYWDLTKEASFDVDIKRRVFLTALEPELARGLAECARQQGVSTETLINV